MWPGAELQKIIDDYSASHTVAELQLEKNQDELMGLVLSLIHI